MTPSDYFHNRRIYIDELQQPQQQQFQQVDDNFWMKFERDIDSFSHLDFYSMY